MKKIYVLIALIIMIIPLTGCLQQSTVKSAVYKIGVEAIQNINYDPPTQTFTILVKVENDILVDYHNPMMNFSFEIVPPPGSDRDDYAYLFFSSHDYDPRIFRDSNGIYQLIWTDGDTTYLVNGNKRLEMIENYELQLELKLNPFQLLEIQDSSLQITFHNMDNSWSDTYTIKFIGVDIDV